MVGGGVGEKNEEIDGFDYVVCLFDFGLFFFYKKIPAPSGVGIN